MRMSVRKSDPGYHPKAHFYNVLLDGKNLPECFTADEDKGYALVNKTGPDGKVVLNEDKTEIVTEKVFGKVEIVKGKT